MAQRYTPPTDESVEKYHSATRTDTINTMNRLQPAFGGEFQPGLHQNVPAQKKLANPAPLGLGAFALTTFVLSTINLGTNKVAEPNLVVALAYGYGGLIQLLAGMWEMAVGNTFGATALSSYGGFWISFGVSARISGHSTFLITHANIAHSQIILTPAFGITSAYTGATTGTFSEVFALYLWAWFIFTTLMRKSSSRVSFGPMLTVK